MADDLPREQVEEFQEAFDMFDRDGSGVVKLAALGTVMRSLGLNPITEKLDAMIDAAAGAREAGGVDFPQFLAMMAREMSDDDPEEAIREAFQVFDRDGTGFISASELRLVMTNLGKGLDGGRHHYGDDSPVDAPAGGDDKISYNDFVKMMMGK
jgi:calmodulin